MTWTDVHFNFFFFFVRIHTFNICTFNLKLYELIAVPLRFTRSTDLIVYLFFSLSLFGLLE